MTAKEWLVEWHTPFGTEEAELWCAELFEAGSWRVFNKPVIYEITPITYPIFAFKRSEYAVLFALKWKTQTRINDHD